MPSQDFLFDIFPDLAKLLQNQLPFVLDHAFPKATAEMCPTPTWSTGIQGFEKLGWPGLEVACALGMLIGLFGAFQHFGRISAKGQWFWGMSMLFFGFMNPTAWLAHAYFRQLPTGNTSPVWAWFIYLDVAWTCTSSAFLALAVLNDGGYLDDRNIATRLISLLVPVAAVWGGHVARENGVTWVSEIEYIGTTAFAAVLAIYILIAKPYLATGKMPNDLGHLAIAVVGCLIFAAGPPLDAYMCKIVGNPYGNMLLPAFFGCDIGFIGLLGYSNAVHKRRSVNGKGKAA